ncbi:hypothetical protein J1765_gp58 [Gordonia phage Gaea]|uniref:Uncharacterized protein n=2 Tax=Kroosvirus TaxID=2948789 RepID=A0A515ML17_9CAUD|nr:hypothetical protein J1765_gp58 [Gordonia phage Gaea]YP_010002106.1 hypothetical protein J1767_gp57 [Gordonia phage Tangerine]AYR02866.1 hypothetical protein SEA_GAEA_58 [Gordonia phage Gaea]QDM57356.1 hypothetical protein SEA_TANGERINE_57 [Gordonia phage Tangerine]WMI33066.1 hypothetical protein SEA_SCHOTTB_55 [Gordonia Phage SchottB]
MNACGAIAWLASIGSATVVCSLDEGHDGPHRDDYLDVEWSGA